MATSNPLLSTFVSAVKAAGLEDMLSGAKPFTVFAPSNDAFAKMTKSVTEDLFKPESKAKLTTLLKRHVLSGEHMASEFAGKSTDIATLDGAKVAINGKDGHVSVDAAKVSTANLAASNGVIHVIDTVLAPAPIPA
jgi:uncharacterized surface protein with fasciclin (FAS1) repeats